MAAGVLGIYFRTVTHDQMLRHERSRAEDLTQVFENSLWPKFRLLIDTSIAQTPDELRRKVADARLRDDLATMMRGTDVIKIKIYNLQGVTVFSTDLTQIGESKADNAGFISAVRGAAIGELIHRNQFDAFEGVLQDRDVIATYVPIHALHDGTERVGGVFEVYEDVTTFVHSADEKLKWVSASVLLVLAALYLAQFLVVRRAQRILRSQAIALEQANSDLDRRVQERTHDLQNEVNERRRAEQRLDHLAHHDPLTGLPNRLQFGKHLADSLRATAAAQQQLAVLFLDLDHFKDVNDTMGHSVGDALLIAVTVRLQAQLRERDVLSRLGGDEFILVAQGIRSSEDAAQLARNLLGVFQQAFEVFENHFYLSASIGVSMAPGDGWDADILVRNADAAMYDAKAQGRNRCHFYTPAMTEHAQKRVYMAALLREAIGKREFAVHFQPKVDAVHLRLSGAESLLRWTSEELGPVSPVSFIPLAEENGLIVELGAWVLRESCKQLAAWDSEGFHIPRLSINLSVKQLERGDFIALLRQVLEQTGVDPARIEFEITESVILAVEDAFVMLEDLRATGVSLSIDDFGTGYSSLSYLKRLPVQTLKIDRSFITGIGDSRADEAIIRSVVTMSQSMGLHIVAEGVETEPQATFLRTLGCDQFQGFLYGRPLDAQAFQMRWQT